MTELRRIEFHDMVGALPEFSVVAGKTALMVINIQYLNAHRDWGVGRWVKEKGLTHLSDYYFDRLEKLVIPNIQRLQQACRKADLLVVHVRVAAQRPDASDTGWRFKQLGLLCALGSKESEILAEVAPLPGEVVLNKTTADVFISTNAEHALRNMGVDTLIVAGVSTNGSVESSARGAGDRGFKVLVVEDACAAFNLEMHQASLRSLHRVFAWVVSTQEALRQIAA